MRGRHDSQGQDISAETELTHTQLLALADLDGGETAGGGKHCISTTARPEKHASVRNMWHLAKVPRQLLAGLDPNASR